ncbi:YadA-like family protein [Escherichia coli]|uniref:YadA-like family protein n=1 Tax=Escherichia coli TaxID=562 RepID=UPI002FC6EC4D
MLKRRDAFLKKSALAVSMALLLSAQAQAQAILIGPIQPGDHSSFLFGNSVAGRSSGDIRNVWLIGDDSFLLDSNRTVLLGNNSFVLGSPGSVSLGHDALIADSEWGTVAGKEASLISSRQSSAIGAFSSVQDSTSSVALGHGSQVSGENNVVSVGAGPEGYGESVKGAPETRRIINVSDGVKDSDAATKGQMDNAIADAVRVSGDALRGEIGGVYRDARAHTDSQVTAVRDELKAEGDSLRGEIGGVYRDALKEAKSQAEHLSDVLVKNRAQTDAAIASNTAAIRNNSHRLDLTEAWQKMATERMNNMQEQIKENRKELRESAAQSAALAGLFQPYSVGKFNATAAVGGYRDEQAIAVGVGYRFTENVAGKVAVAAGGSSASWNAGVNFEF